MPVPLRTDFNAAALRTIARQTKDGPQARRLLALAAIYEGASRTEAARIGGVTVQIVRDWVMKFNALGPEGLVNRKPPGQPSKLTDAHRAALVARVDEGPIPAILGVFGGSKFIPANNEAYEPIEEVAKINGHLP